MRWLALKDLRLMSRSPLLVGLLVLYPIVIALLIGLALSRSPSKPRVAIVNLVPVGETINLGGQHVDINTYANRLYQNIQPVIVSTPQEAAKLVREGRVLAALIIPPDIVGKLSSGLESAQVQVLYDGNALQQSLVQASIEQQLGQANAALSRKLEQVAAGYIGLLQRGGQLQLFGDNLKILGLERAKTMLDGVLATEPPGKNRRTLARVDRFASLAVQNLGLATDVLASVRQPVRVQSRLLQGRRTPLDDFAVAVAVTVSLMFMCVLLASGSLALEREENAFMRLVRGLVSREGLLAEKALLAAACSFVVAFAMLAGVAALVGLDWGRAGMWIIGLAASAIAFGSLGVAVGAIAREVRAASLLAFAVALPLAFLALVPSGSVTGGLYQVIRVVSAVFPFKAALQAMDAAINGASPGLGISVLHLVVLTVTFAVIARVALRRFAA